MSNEQNPGRWCDVCKARGWHHTDRHDAFAPVSSGEAGRGGRCELDMCGGPPCWCGQDRPAPVITPNAEDGQP